MAGTLDGLLVVALEQAVAAPLCSQHLADAGARVIKVERPGGDFARGYDAVVHGESAYFVWLNRGKESVTLDLKRAVDKAVMERMLARADIYIQNLATGAAGRLGFGTDAWRARRPELITCDISGYGEAGPYAGMKAYDLLVQAESGLASVTGSAGEMGRVGVSVCDIAAGMNAYAAILEALIAKAKTGAGTGIKVSLFDGMADWMTVPLLHFDYGGTAPARAGLHHPSIAPYGAYAYHGGEVLISIQNDREWRAFAETVLANAALATDPRFATNVARVAPRPRGTFRPLKCRPHRLWRDQRSRWPKHPSPASPHGSGYAHRGRRNAGPTRPNRCRAHARPGAGTGPAHRGDPPRIFVKRL
jgi:crotonobetainyl-CoA:carnitine CoA-transferase CaiB-like acyl-CoA transferase